MRAASLIIAVLLLAAAGAPERIHITDNRGKLDLFIRTPVGARAVAVIVGCEHGTKESVRSVEGAGGQERFLFRELHAEEHAIAASILTGEDKVERYYRTAFVQR
jgi:hypothetical protein